MQQPIELDFGAFLGAEHQERTEERICHCNGYWPRILTTQMGDHALQIPKLRAGSSLPSTSLPTPKPSALITAS